MSTQEFTDRPLKSVTRDNLDLDIYIGPQDAFHRPNGVIEPTDDARSYSSVELEIFVSNNDEANYAMGDLWHDTERGELSVKPSEGNPPLEDSDPEIITIDVKHDLTEIRPSGEEVTRIWTGVISNSSRLGGGGFEFMSYWPGYDVLQNEKLNIESPSPELQDVANLIYDYANAFRPASDIAEDIGQQVTRDSPFESTVNIEDGGVEIENAVSGAIRKAFDFNINLDTPPDKTLLNENGGVLRWLADMTDATWEIDRYGDFYIGPPRGERKKVRFITDTSAGKRSPQYRSVRVIGDGVVSQSGFSKSKMISEKPITKSQQSTEQIAPGIDDVDPVPTSPEDFGTIPPSQIDPEFLAEPTFVYTNRMIQTEEQANHVLQKLTDELQEQYADGEVTIVGHAGIWPGDTIEMPDSRDQQFALDRYGVHSVRHRLNSEDGFLTIIGVSGINRNKAVLYPDLGLEDEEKDTSDTERQDSDKTDESEGTGGGDFRDGYNPLTGPDGQLRLT